MNTNEAPEKIYITPNIDRKWQLEAIDDESIEYTRTDAFIEKAEKWLIENQKGWILTDEDITEFINYMKGE